MKRDGVEALSDLALARAIRDLSVRLERLDRDASPRALVHGCYLQAVLDAALAERERRRGAATEVVDPTAGPAGTNQEQVE